MICFHKYHETLGNLYVDNGELWDMDDSIYVRNVFDVYLASSKIYLLMPTIILTNGWKNRNFQCSCSKRMTYSTISVT